MAEAVKKRIPELDIAKGIAIMAVIMVHIPSEYRLHGYIAFHIVTFFAVTGILERDNITPHDNLVKKLKSMMYPYLTMSVIYILLKTLYGIVAGSFALNDLLVNVYLTLSLSGIGTLWFLPAAFLGSVIYTAVRSRFGSRSRVMLLVALVAALAGGELLYKVGVFGSISYTFTGLFTNELQVVFKGVIAAGYMELGRIVWDLIPRAEKGLRRPAFLLAGGV